MSTKPGQLQRALESQLKTSTNQSQIRKQLGETVDRLFYEIGMDWLDLRLQMSQQAGTAERLQKQLPKWFQKLIDLTQKRGGLPVAGGALRPFNLENTTGNRPEPQFKGEVVPHHALPEKQREGLRPGVAVHLLSPDLSSHSIAALSMLLSQRDEGLQTWLLQLIDRRVDLPNQLGALTNRSLRLNGEAPLSANPTMMRWS